MYIYIYIYVYKPWKAIQRYHHNFGNAPFWVWVSSPVRFNVLRQCPTMEHVPIIDHDLSNMMLFFDCYVCYTGV